MAKLTDAQKKRAKEISRAAGVKYPNAWANLAVSKGQGEKALRKVKANRKRK